MSHKYTWDENLLKKYQENPDLEKELKEIFTEITRENEIILPSYLKTLKSDIAFFQKYNFVYPQFNSILNNDLNYLTIQRSKTKISLDEALKLTNSFYSTLDSSILSAFNTHFAKRFTHLKEFSFYDDYLAGECYFMEKAQDCLIEIKPSKRFSMVGSLIHEYAHAIAFTLRDYTIPNLNNTPFLEIESLFMELIAYHYFIKNNIFKIDAQNEMHILYNDILDIFKNTIEVHEICSMVKDMQEDHKKINMHSILKEARQDFADMTSFDIKNLLKVPIENNIPYAYSYLIAAELYEIYLSNPDYAFYLYKKVITLDKKTALETLQSFNKLGLKAGEHFSDFTRSLKR